jgi:hypothetical protein
MIYSVNYSIGVRSMRGDKFTFVENDTDNVHIGGMECLFDTPVGKEMDALEKEVDHYVMNVNIELVLRKKRADYSLLLACFDNTQSIRNIYAKSAPGCIPWQTTINKRGRLLDVRAAEKFIAARRIWLYARDIIRELPQPIAEEIEEHFEFDW